MQRLLEELIHLVAVRVHGIGAQRTIAERGQFARPVGHLLQALEAGQDSCDNVNARGSVSVLRDLALFGLEIQHATDGGGIVFRLGDAAADFKKPSSSSLA